MASIEQFPFVSISGTPYERGVQYGKQARDRVMLSASVYGNALAELGFTAQEKSALIAGFLTEIERFGPHYVEEMRGIAEGAGVALEDIVMVNARTEVLAKGRALKKQRQQADKEPEDGCTGALVLPERSASGNLIHGQNWDWRAECGDTAIVLRVRQDDGPDFLTFVEAGGLARSGFNSAGVSITANYLESDRDFTQSGVPLALLRRKVLEQAHFALAMKAVASTPKSCSNNIMLGMADGFGIDYECTTDEAFAVYPGQDGLIVHANHWTSDVALCKLRDTGRRNSPDSQYRDWRVRRQLNGKPLLDREDMKRAFFDDFGTPYSVCRPPRPGSHGTRSASVAMIVMEPAAGIMEVAPLPALNRVFTRYGLEGDPVELPAFAQ